ncbi:MAG: alpha/beta fold hydrolase [Gammaproteobacteria bacterium]|nr:alpha/beta fold hydrolase [Gammaproteobacteria bacterium]
MASSALYQDPHIKYPIYDLNLNFADYISQCKTIIKTHRQDLTNADAERIIEANSPFELIPKKDDTKKIRYGALLIHGLLDAPFAMRDIGAHLQEQGMLVRAVLLPGHGTVPGALLNVSFEEWLQTMRYGIANLSKDVDHLFLVGFSTGASLALMHALEHLPNRVIGLILLAPAIKIYSSLGFLTNWHRAISWAIPRAQWVHITAENDYTKYQSMCFNAAYQVYRLTQKIRKLETTKPLAYPVLACISQEDKTVSSEATLAYFQEHTDQNSELIVYTNHPEKYSDPRIIPRAATYPKWHIIGISHVCLPIAPNNSHYGLQGDYIDASHAEEVLPFGKKVAYGPYNTAEYLVLNVLYQWGWNKEKHTKLTFNPDFDFLKQAIDSFSKKAILSSTAHHTPA